MSQRNIKRPIQPPAWLRWWLSISEWNRGFIWGLIASFIADLIVTWLGR